MGAGPQAQAPPHDASKTSSNPRGTARCGRCGSTGASPSTSVLDRALSRSILAMGGQAPPLPNALTATHASDADDEIQLTTRPRSHHSALQGEATPAQCADPLDRPCVGHANWMVTRCLTPARTGRSAAARARDGKHPGQRQIRQGCRHAGRGRITLSDWRWSAPVAQESAMGGMVRRWMRLTAQIRASCALRG
jgi:hypothetical protein